MKKDYTNLIHAERTSITPSGFFGSSSKMIQCRENFLDDENALKVLNFVKTISFWDETVTKYNDTFIGNVTGTTNNNFYENGSVLYTRTPSVSEFTSVIIFRLNLSLFYHLVHLVSYLYAN